MKKPHSAKSNSGLRGDYEGAAPDYTVGQEWQAYTPQMHERWRRLYDRQRGIVEQHAARQFLDGLNRFECADGIPDFDKANVILSAETGWQIVAVPGFIPDDVFFDHLANRRFPVTRWLREENELDYLVEPDVFHDFFGHVPMLLDPRFADFMEAYGKGGQRAMAMDALDMLARIYWYTVEFGLIEQDGTLKAFGSGIVSSAGETVYSVSDPDVLRLRFEPVRIMRTAYEIDSFQKTYFVLDSIEQLVRGLTELDFGPIYERWRKTPAIPAGQTIPGDAVWTAPRIAGESSE